MQIRTRLTIQFAGLMAGLLLVSLTVIYGFAANAWKNNFHNRLRAKASTNAVLLFNIEAIDSVLLRRIDENRKDVLPEQNIRIYNQNDRVIYTSNDTIDYGTTAEDLALIRNEGEVTFNRGEYEIIGLSYETRAGKFVITAGANDIVGKGNLHSLRRILLAVFFAGLLLVGFAGWVYAGRALRPIRRIMHKMERITADNLDERLDESRGTDEIARLAQTFNGMLTRLEQSFNLQKNFVANVSHELKNPLTMITAQLEVALLRQRDSEEYRRTIESVLEDTKGLNRAALALLDLARVTADDVSLPMAPTRIDEVLWHCREQLLIAHPEYKIQMDFDLPEDEQGLLLQGNAYLLNAAFLNLMDNGCKFSPKREVTVLLRMGNGQLAVHVRDEGIGISEKDLESIFQPFFRGSNSSAARGHGIGLSLVAHIMESHHATIDVKSKPGAGTEFILNFPMIAPQTH